MAPPVEGSSKIEKSLFWLCISSLVLVIFGCGVFLWHEYKVEHNMKTYSLYNATMEEKPGISGLWFPEGYYCVWAAGRNLQEINDSDTHERCHALVHEDPEHFCEYYCENKICKEGD